MFCSPKAMRISRAGIVFLVGTALGFAASLPPLTVKEVSLMLRSGYSSDAVAHEIETRHFLGPVDAAGEKTLVQAGASPALISTLKAGTFAVPTADQASVKAELAAKAQRRAAQIEESRKLDTLYQAQQEKERKTAAELAASKNNGTSIASLVKGNLVASKNGVLHPYLDADFEKKKLIGLYFSAHWCAPCRQFTPNLVAFYNKNVTAHPEFEILFVSNDKTAAAMEGYMREVQMPWPAVTYDKIVGNGPLLKYAGSSIPCLVVVDETGKVIFDTYAGQNYRGPEAVLNDLNQLFGSKSSGGETQLAKASN
ncbi:MAG: thioredoxin-like domain-containing protein [Chthoniobacterales bacterium]